MRACWLAALLLGGGVAPAADVEVAGHWTRVVNRFDLSAGAGSDLVPAIESAAGVATVSILNTAGGSWRVSVAQTAGNLPQQASIAVRRSGNEAGVSGGFGYLTVGTTPQEFFTGVDDRSVQIQLKVTGTDVHTAATLYNLTLTYSVEAL